MKGLAHSWLPVLSRTAWSGPNIWMTNTFSLSDLAWQPTSLPSLTTAGRERRGGARALSWQGGMARAHSGRSAWQHCRMGGTMAFARGSASRCALCSLQQASAAAEAHDGQGRTSLDIERLEPDGLGRVAAMGPLHLELVAMGVGRSHCKWRQGWVRGFAARGVAVAARGARQAHGLDLWARRSAPPGGLGRPSSTLNMLGVVAEEDAR